MRSFNTLLLLLGLVSVAFGKAIDDSISIEDLENNQADIDSMTVYYDYDENNRRYPGDGYLCAQSRSRCTIANGDNLGNFKFSGYDCSLTEIRAGPDDYTQYVSTTVKESHYNIDVNGYLQCVTKKNGKRVVYNRFRKFNLKGRVNYVTPETFYSYIDSFYNSIREVHEGSQSYVVNNKLSLTLKVSKCTSVFSHKTYKKLQNCEVNK